MLQQESARISTGRHDSHVHPHMPSRQVVVHHARDVWNVQTTGSDICGHQNGRRVPCQNVREYPNPLPEPVPNLEFEMWPSAWRRKSCSAFSRASSDSSHIFTSYHSCSLHTRSIYCLVEELNVASHACFLSPCMEKARNLQARILSSISRTASLHPISLMSITATLLLGMGQSLYVYIYTDIYIYIIFLCIYASIFIYMYIYV